MRVFTKLHMLALYAVVWQRNKGEVRDFKQLGALIIPGYNGEITVRVSQQKHKMLQN